MVVLGQRDLSVTQSLEITELFFRRTIALRGFGQIIYRYKKKSKFNKVSKNSWYYVGPFKINFYLF